MANSNSIYTVLFVLLIFGALYFAALGIVELKKLITRHRNKKEDEQK